MMYLDTLKKREPEFVWELKQAALRCRLINEQRKKNGLPSLENRSRRSLRPISTTGLSSYANDQIASSETESHRRMCSFFLSFFPFVFLKLFYIFEAVRFSHRIRGEQPDLSLPDAEALVMQRKPPMQRRSIFEAADAVQEADSCQTQDDAVIVSESLSTNFPVQENGVAQEQDTEADHVADMAVDSPEKSNNLAEPDVAVAVQKDREIEQSEVKIMPMADQDGVMELKTTESALAMSDSESTSNTVAMPVNEISVDVCEMSATSGHMIANDNPDSNASSNCINVDDGSTLSGIKCKEAGE
jgi:hypothetical protein